MTTYRVEVQRGTHDGRDWDPIIPACVVDDQRITRHLCRTLALLQRVPPARPWRVRVWVDGVDNSAEPIAEVYSHRTK